MKTLPEMRLLFCVNKGQALVEFATFAAIFLVVLSLLVRYGLSINYYQQSMMTSLRRAQNEARALGTGTVRSPSVTLVEDRRMPNTQDEFGITPRTPVVTGAALTWSEGLNPENLDHDDSETPRQNYIIDGNERDYVFRVASQEYRYCDRLAGDTPIMIRVKCDDLTDADGDNIFWEWSPPFDVWDNYDSEDQAIKYHIDADGEKESISIADIAEWNGSGYVFDGKEESITEVIKNVVADDPETEEDESTEEIAVWYLDSQKGDLDLTVDSKDIKYGKYKQGLFDTYLGSLPTAAPSGNIVIPGDDRMTIINPPGSTFRREETPVYYKTTTDYNVYDYIYRTIILNKPAPGSQLWIESTIPKDEKVIWKTQPLP
ncbi:MAG: hypothetical protein V1674_06595 [Candidatus Omnitrophota bacterium]